MIGRPIVNRNYMIVTILVTGVVLCGSLYQPRQVVLRHIVLHARRQKLCLVDLPGAKFLAHKPTKNHTPRLLTSEYSDRLPARLIHCSSANEQRMWRKAAIRFMILVAKPVHWSKEERHTRHDRGY